MPNRVSNKCKKYFFLLSKTPCGAVALLHSSGDGVKTGHRVSAQVNCSYRPSQHPVNIDLDLIFYQVDNTEIQYCQSWIKILAASQGNWGYLSLKLDTGGGSWKFVSSNLPSPHWYSSNWNAPPAGKVLCVVCSSKWGLERSRHVIGGTQQPGQSPKLNPNLGLTTSFHFALLNVYFYWKSSTTSFCSSHPDPLLWKGKMRRGRTASKIIARRHHHHNSIQLKSW